MSELNKNQEKKKILITVTLSSSSVLSISTKYIYTARTKEPFSRVAHVPT
jgi:hypothetical protein